MRWLVAAVFVCGAAFAQQQKGGSEKAKQKLPERVVAGTRTEEEAETVPAWVSVLTQDDVAFWQTVSLKEMLFGLPGMWVKGSGGFSYQNLLYLRGTKPTQSLFLLEGIKLNDPTLGNQVDLSTVAPLGVSQVEILRGTSSALYGSDAIGGVVLLRLTPPATTPRTMVTLTGGRYNTAGASFTHTGTIEKTALLLSASSVSCDNRYPNYNTTRNALSLSAKSTYKRTKTALVLHFTDRLSHWPFDYDFLNNKLLWDENITHHNTVAVAGFRFEGLLTEKLTLLFAPSASFLRAHFLNGPDTTGNPNELESVSSAVRTGAALQTLWRPVPENLREVFDMKVVFGGEYSHIRAQSESASSGSVSSWSKPADITAAFAQTLTKTPLGNFQLGVRWDKNSLYGDAVCPRIGVSVPVGKFICTTRHGWRLHLKGSFGRGFRAPSLSEIADPWVGNPKLKAEKSTGGDAGVLIVVPSLPLKIEAVYFRTKVTNMIAYSFTTWKLENIQAARIEGVEFATGIKVADKVNLRCSFTHQDPRDLNTKEYLPKVSRNFGTLGFDWRPHKTLRFGLLVRLSEPYGKANVLSVRGTPRGKVGNVKEVTVLVGWSPRNWFTVEARVENLLNEDYLEDELAPRANDRAAYFGIVVRF